MDYFWRQKKQYFSGQFRPYWLPYLQPGRPPVLVVQVPVPIRMDNKCANLWEPTKSVEAKAKSRAQRNRDFKRSQAFREKKSVCAILPFYELDGQDLKKEIEDCTVTGDTVKFRKTENPVMPGSELSDKEFHKLFYQPANVQDLAAVVNDTLVCSLRRAESKVKDLEAVLNQLKSSYMSVTQQHSMEKEQSNETLDFHINMNEMLRWKITDLEERNRQLKEANETWSSACERLLDDKEQLKSTVQSCFENLDSYSKMKKDKTKKGTQKDTQPMDTEQECEWCPIVKAFYRVCSPT